MHIFRFLMYILAFNIVFLSATSGSGVFRIHLTGVFQNVIDLW
jgi:hypothetical protein